MSPRRIFDETGAAWELWEVDPSRVELWEKHAAAMRLPTAADPALPTPVAGEFKGGWLTARSGQERRRISPVPTDWLFMTDSQLRQLVERARPRPDADRRRPTDSFLEPTPQNPRCHVRAFADAAGMRWDVWEAHPALRDRRAAVDRRAAPRGSPDRRTMDVPGYGRGWLVFRNGMVRHRLHSIPAGWAELSDDDLRMLLASAARSREGQRRPG
jgi:hypothetical protein